MQHKTRASPWRELKCDWRRFHFERDRTNREAFGEVDGRNEESVWIASKDWATSWSLKHTTYPSPGVRSQLSRHGRVSQRPFREEPEEASERTVLAERRPEPRYLEDDSVEERVVGGEVARPNSWPWQISLQFKSIIRYRHTCGGTLIKRGWVMTAAHCVDSSRDWRVVLGDHNINSHEGSEQYMSVSRVHIHPNWNSNNVAGGWDIALLRLSTEATLNNNVQLGALPPSGQVLPNKNPCYISGWGRTATGGQLSDQLKQAYLPSVDHRTCSGYGWWGSTVKDSMVCAGGGRESGCQGDSGGPLNCIVNGNWVVHGVTSFVSSYGCNATKKPTVFTRVSAYIGWMNGIMG